MRYSETTGGLAETVGDGCTVWKQQAAMLCLRRRRLTGGWVFARVEEPLYPSLRADHLSSP
ncbi:MAG: hypothetical protein LBD24_04745 [Spirochaetaceae bacterium]|nr:hypothetical protein [Spirochaetaceae bacterium]